MQKITTKEITIISLIAALLIVGELVSSVLPKMPNGGSLDIKVLFLLIAIVYLLQTFKEIKIFWMILVATIINVLIGWILIYKHVVFPIGLFFDYLLPQIVYCFLVFWIKKNNVTLVLVSGIVMSIAFSSYVISGMVVWQTPFIGSIIYNISWFWPMIILIPISLILAKNKLL